VTAEHHFLQQLTLEPAMMVTVKRHRGSVPREEGAWMAVFASSSVGTIGGGHLEWIATTEARERLNGRSGDAVQRYALGPALGQCCGGEVWLAFEPVSAADIQRLAYQFALIKSSWPGVALFGGGHVAQALVQVTANLPLRVNWFDSRDGIFPQALPDNVSAEHSDPVHAAVTSLTPGSCVLIMSFSHAEDLDVVAACLMRQRERADLPFIGLIGSRTKWAAFCYRLQDRGFAAEEINQVDCPIGLPGISGKQPEVIAVAAAAQLLQVIGSTLPRFDETSRMA
jgi:xanthine dehydrogenase accessory factor